MKDIACKNNTHLGAMQFEDLWHHILMESVELSHLLPDGTPMFLFGCPKLHAACAELTAKESNKDLDLVTQQQIQGMLGLLNLYFDEGLNLSWRKEISDCVKGSRTWG